MRELFPSQNQSIAYNNKAISMAEYDALVARLNEVVEDFDNATADFNSYKDEVAEAFYSANLSSNALSAVSAALDNIICDNLQVTGKATIDKTDIINAIVNQLHVDTIQAGHIDAVDATITDVVSDNISNTNKITTKDLEVTGTLTADNQTIDNLTSTNADISNADITTADIGSASINNASIDNATITGNLGVAGVTTLTDVTANDAEIDTLNVTNIIHTLDEQIIDDLDDYLIVLPSFRNGHCYLIGTINDTDTAFSIEVFNSDGNFMIRWSRNAVVYFTKFWIDDTNNVITFKVSGANKLYHKLDTYETVSPINTYDIGAYTPGGIEYDVQNGHATFIPSILYTDKLKVDDLVLDDISFDQLNVNRDIVLPTSKSSQGDILGTSSGTDNQYITVFTDEYGNKYVKWVSPATEIKEYLQTLVSSDTIFNYDGTAYKYDIDSGEFVADYPITELGDGTTVHGNFRSKHIIDSNNYGSSLPADTLDESIVFVQGTDSVTEYTAETADLTEWTVTIPQVDETIYTPISSLFFDKDGNKVALDFIADYNGDWYFVHSNPLTTEAIADSSDITVYSATTTPGNPSTIVRAHKVNNNIEMAAIKGLSNDAITHSGMPLTYDDDTDEVTYTDTLDIDSLEVDNLQVNNDAVISGDTIIHGDLYVDGTSHIVDTETLDTTSDILTLRQNNNISLGTDKAGILINKYNGTKSQALVTDSTGVLRVGNGTTTDTTYASLYYRHADDKYYTDSEFTTEVTPNGALTKWDSVEKTVDYIYWTNAVFSTIEFTNTEITYVISNSHWINSAKVSATTGEVITPEGTRGEQIEFYNSPLSQVYNGYLYGNPNNSGFRRITGVTYNENDPHYPTWSYGEIITQVSDPELWAALNSLTFSNYPIYYSAYTNVANSLEPLLTRDEEENINAEGILKYNKDKHRAESLPLPSVDGSTIVANSNNGKWEYSWQQPQSGIYTFANMAAYNAYTGNIPANSLIVIEDETGYVMSEDAE